MKQNTYALHVISSGKLHDIGIGSAHFLAHQILVYYRKKWPKWKYAGNFSCDSFRVISDIKITLQFSDPRMSILTLFCAPID